VTRDRGSARARGARWGTRTRHVFDLTKLAAAAVKDEAQTPILDAYITTAGVTVIAGAVTVVGTTAVGAVIDASAINAGVTRRGEVTAIVTAIVSAGGSMRSSRDEEGLETKWWQCPCIKKQLPLCAVRGIPIAAPASNLAGATTASLTITVAALKTGIYTTVERRVGLVGPCHGLTHYRAIVLVMDDQAWQWHWEGNNRAVLPRKRVVDHNDRGETIAE
jgi:hypothetical protein